MDENQLLPAPQDRADPTPQNAQELREQFLRLCTARQQDCQHGWPTRPERCIQCVIDEGVSVLAVNRMITAGEITDAHVDAYLETGHASPREDIDVQLDVLARDRLLSGLYFDREFERRRLTGAKEVAAPARAHQETKP